MKRFYIFTALFLIIGGVLSVNAQDLIILKDGNTIEAKVIEISPTEIRYMRLDHLDGPTIVVLAIDVLSIRYENGRTEIINDLIKPAITDSSPSISPAAAHGANQSNNNPHLNTVGTTLGYQGVSALGFTVNGTVSPTDFTFFDFNLGLGFNSFAFNGRINFNAFVPFKSGGWYAGIGIGGGYNELFGGVIAGNITTGFLFFNWLNIAYTLQLGNFDGVVNNNIAVGYSYRFKTQDGITASLDSPDNNTSSKTDAPHTASATIISPYEIWSGGMHTDGRSGGRGIITREFIDGKEQDVLNLEGNLVRGNKTRWTSFMVFNEDVLQRLRNASGVRFKVLGDGNTWWIAFATTETNNNDFNHFNSNINTRNGRIVTIDVPFSRLRQPDWGSRQQFYKNNIVFMFFQFLRGGDTTAAKTSVLKVFDFEIY